MDLSLLMTIAGKSPKLRKQVDNAFDRCERDIAKFMVRDNPEVTLRKIEGK